MKHRPESDAEQWRLKQAADLIRAAGYVQRLDGSWVRDVPIVVSVTPTKKARRRRRKARRKP